MIFSLFFVNKAGGLIYHEVCVSLNSGGLSFLAFEALTEVDNLTHFHTPTSRDSMCVQDFAPVPQQSQNTYLRLASTFHGLHAIAGSLSPVSIRGGIDSIVTEHFRLQCFLTLTGMSHL
jgi:hypothetical protein